MPDDKLKEAFSRIKEDILNTGKELALLKQQLLDSNNLLQQLNDEITLLKLQQLASNTPTQTPTDNPTHPSETPTNPALPTDTPTAGQEARGLISQNLSTPTGNRGVPTDRQTDRQTDNPTHLLSQLLRKIPSNASSQHSSYPIEVPNSSFKYNVVPIQPEAKEKPIVQQLSDASEIIASLDAIKKDIRRKFKRVTQQEMAVFSTIYTFEETDPDGADYKKIAQKLHLSESSIRDYVGKLEEKGIPIIKERINNKKILLHISPQLKKIAPLGTIVQLREL